MVSSLRDGNRVDVAAVMHADSPSKSDGCIILWHHCKAACLCDRVRLLCSTQPASQPRRLSIPGAQNDSAAGYAPFALHSFIVAINSSDTCVIACIRPAQLRRIATQCHVTGFICLV
jgi:hypothetical protein